MRFVIYKKQYTIKTSNFFLAGIFYFDDKSPLE